MQYGFTVDSFADVREDLAETGRTGNELLQRCQQTLPEGGAKIGRRFEGRGGKNGVELGGRCDGGYC